MTNRMKSAIWINGNKLVIDYPQFNGGERNIRIPERFLQGAKNSVYALLFDSSAVMDLLLVCDAVRRMGVRSIDLTIPYLPYARQDRVCNYGEAHSFKVFCGLINSINAASVTVYDPHSYVCEALINNVIIVHQEEPIIQYLGADITYDVIISPDGGAIKKAFNLAREIGAQFESAVKFRNVSTGEVEKSIFQPIESIDGKKCIIIDDIGDGMASFMYLAKEIFSENSPLLLDLYVTHAICSNGTKEVYKYFENIFTLDYTNPNDAKIIRLD